MSSSTVQDSTVQDSKVNIDKTDVNENEFEGTEDPLQIIQQINGVKIEQTVYPRKKSIGTRRINSYNVYSLPDELIKFRTNRMKLKRRVLPNAANVPLFAFQESSNLAFRLLFDKIIFPSDYFGLGRLRPLTLKAFGHKKYYFSNRPLLFVIKKDLGFQTVTVTNADNTVIGTIQLVLGIIPKFKVIGKNNEVLFMIKGNSHKATIRKGENKVGAIRKHDGNINNGNYGSVTLNVTFPKECTLDERLLLIAATMYINIIYVETKNNLLNNISLLKHLLRWFWQNPVFKFRNAQKGYIV